MDLTREETLLASAIAQFVHQGRWPDAPQFRVEHEQDRDILDDLRQRGLLRLRQHATGYAYAVTPAGLATVTTPEAMDLRNQTRSLLGLFKEKYREKPGHLWDAGELRRLAKERDVQFFEQVIELLEPAAVVQSADKDGVALSVVIAESILDVADDVFPPALTRDPVPGQRPAVLVQRIQPRGLLSFSPAFAPLDLQPLNLLIGPNGSGKSNLLEALALLRAAPASLAEFFRHGTSADEWLHRSRGKTCEEASIEVVTGASLTAGPGARELRHRLAFVTDGLRRVISDERLENASAWKGQQRPYLFFGYDAGRPRFNVVRSGPRMLQREELRPGESALSQRSDARTYPEVCALAAAYRGIRLYRDWVIGPDAPYRQAPRADVPDDHLDENCGNLAVVVGRLKKGSTWPRLLEELRRFYPPVTDLETLPMGPGVQLNFLEHGGRTPASRMSDGTLRYLCLLAVLLDPEPPTLVGLEEPELGMHPDMLPHLARLLREASERMQLVVTTHSELLVDAFTATPEVILVCERDDEGTTLRRLDAAELADWLKDHSGLGDLWMRGFLGGTRW
ncbi:MAG: AAA family ATPase [Deltaproteobacteria bacterium]|nr:AAA family ATPase [Deltaproteobacteria bacterium]